MRNFLPVLTVLFLSSSLSATEGVVQRVTRGPDGDLVLRVGTDGDWFVTTVPGVWGIRLRPLLDCRVWFAGEPSDRRLELGSPSDLEILAPPPEKSPELSARKIRLSGLVHLPAPRQQLTGKVLFAGDGGKQLMLEDANAESVEVSVEDGAECRPGDTVRVLGYLEALPSGQAVLQVAGDGEFVRLARAPLGLPPRSWLWISVALAAVTLLFVFVLGWIAILRRVIARQAVRLAESTRGKIRLQAETDATLRERMRLSGDLHDGFQQLLAGAMYRLDAGLSSLPDGSPVRAEFEGARQSLEHAQNGLRSVLWMIASESDGPRTLSGLFRHAVSRLPHWQSAVHLKFEGEEKTLARSRSGTLLMILLESVGNALRHGGATFVSVKVDFGENGLVLTVADNGRGFDVAAAERAAGSGGHFGLANIRRRVESSGGTLTIESAPFEGATITVAMPYDGGIR